MKDLSQNSSRAVRVISASPSANQNDYAPTGWTLPSVRRFLRLTPTASVVITGLGALNDGDLVTVLNSSTFLVVLASENASSLAANRFDLTEGAERGHCLLAPGCSRDFIYDGSISRFRPIAEGFVLGRFKNRASIYPGSGTAPQAIGLPFTSGGGTISHPAQAAGSYRAQLRRWRGATGGTAGTQSGSRVALGTVWRGNAAGLGGFLCRYIWGYSALPAAVDSSFTGLLGTSAAPGNVDISTLTNVLGWGKDPTQTTLRHLVNDAAGACVATDLGANYPVNTTAVYEGAIYSEANGSRVSFALWRLDDLTVTPNVRDASTDIPANTVFLAHHSWICNRAGAADYQIETALIDQVVP